MSHRLTHLLLVILLLTATAAARQTQSLRIGEIEFFGVAGADLGKIRAALPVREGDRFDPDKWPEEKERVRQAIKATAGRDPTDVAATCCDAQGGVIIYIGLSGKTIRYLSTPKGSARLPEDIVRLYDQTNSLVEEAVRTSAAGDDPSKGYSLSAYPPLRAVQLRLRAYAVGHERLLRDVLETSSDSKHRAAAAEALGYGRRTESQISALAAAARDADEGVRNNATRALVVLAAADSTIVRQIPPDNFVGMLLSGTWTDLNKGGALLAELTKGRHPALLTALRRPDVLGRLVEMARWRSDHANPARYILGRVAGIEEGRLVQLIAAKQVDAIINALGDAGLLR